MDYEVVVIGGGVGGLTAAALLAARGVRVGLFERAAQVGGCVAPVEASGFRFDPGAGWYAGWGAGEIQARVFAELGEPAPEARLLDTPFAVRLPDGTEFVAARDPAAFAEQIQRTFPECASEALAFYRDLESIGAALDRAVANTPDLVTSSAWQRAQLIAAELSIATGVLAVMRHTAARFLANASDRFRRFIDAQLQLFGLCDSAACAYLYAAAVLRLPAHGLYRVTGGGAAVAAALERAIKQHGGAVHCHQTVLRLVRGADGRAMGVDLLNGERVTASRAVVSNLTAADTFAKLIGRDATPAAINAKLQSGAAWGTYQMFLSADADAVGRLPAESLLALTDWQFDQPFAPERSLLTLSAADDENPAPAGRRAITVSTFSETAPWFAFQTDGSEHDALEQAELERWWTLLHGVVPELADGLEVIATATPRTIYDDTRRALGAVGGLGQSLLVFGPNALTHRTPVPGLYLTGDSVFPGNGVAAVTMSGLIVANEIAPLT